MKNNLRTRGKANLVLISLCILGLLINVILGGGNRFWIFISGGGYLKDWGDVSFSTVFVQGQFWRLLTCGYIHLGIFHMLANVYALWCFGGIMEERLGTIKYIVVYHMAMMISAIVWIVIFQQCTMVGASLGIISIYGVYFIWRKTKDTKGQNILCEGNRNYIIGYAIVGNVIWYTSTIVHFISFIVGGVFCLLFCCKKRSKEIDEFV